MVERSFATYKGQVPSVHGIQEEEAGGGLKEDNEIVGDDLGNSKNLNMVLDYDCLLYTSPSPRD